MKKNPKPTISRNDQNMGPTDGTVSQAAWSICAGSRQGGVLDVLAQQQRVPEILNVLFQRLTGRGIVGVLAQRAQRREGGYAVDDPLFRTADELGNSRNLRIQRPCGDQTERPGDFDLHHAFRELAVSGSPNTVNGSGAGSVCHMPSMTAIFIF